MEYVDRTQKDRKSTCVCLNNRVSKHWTYRGEMSVGHKETERVLVYGSKVQGSTSKPRCQCWGFVRRLGDKVPAVGEIGENGTALMRALRGFKDPE